MTSREIYDLIYILTSETSKYHILSKTLHCELTDRHTRMFQMNYRKIKVIPTYLQDECYNN